MYRNRGNRIKPLWFIFRVLFILLSSLFALLYYKYHNKDVHLSFDDVCLCIKDLNNKDYESVFQQDFLCELKKLHDKYGCKFSLYIYEEDNDYSINSFTERYSKEFAQNSDWLKFGYHAKNPYISKDKVCNIDTFNISYLNVSNGIRKKFGNAQCRILRLHYFYCSRAESLFLRRNGINCLLSSDDCRNSYSLPEFQNIELLKNERLKVDGIEYKRTDIRLEKDNYIESVFSNMNDQEIVLFTHEWAYEKSVKFKLHLFALLFYLCNCHFIN